MPVISFILVCFIVSFINYFSKGAPLYLKLFPVFLFLVLVCEYLGYIMKYRHQNNLYLYNIIIIIEFLFYLFFFYSVYRVSTAKKTVIALMIAYLAGALINMIFIQGMKVFHTYSYMIGCLLVIAGSIYYFLQLFRYPQTGSIMRDPAFWIASALLFYYACVLPVYGILNYISSMSRYFNHTLRFIINFMNILLYSLFTLAFLCKLSIRKSMS
jgi:hypothetical protein